LVQLNWPTGTVRCWNGYHDLTWDSQTWIGTGHLGSVGEIGENSDGTANGLSITLSGIPASVLSNALENNSQGQPAKVWFGVIQNQSFSVDPYLVFDGMIDTASISDEGGSATVTINLEKEMIDDRTTASRYTHEDQQRDFPGDLGLEYVAGLANRQFMWGKAVVAPVGSGGTGGGNGGGNGELQ
jgi:hypothetical protein